MFTVQNTGTDDPDLLDADWCPATNYVSVFFNTAWNWPGCTDYTTLRCQ